MLILVGVTVTVAINGGLFGKAREGAKGTETERQKEEVTLAVASAYDVSTGTIKKDELETALGKQVDGEEGGPYNFTIGENNFIVCENGKILVVDYDKLEQLLSKGLIGEITEEEMEKQLKKELQIDSNASFGEYRIYFMDMEKFGDETFFMYLYESDIMYKITFSDEGDMEQIELADKTEDEYAYKMARKLKKIKVELENVFLGKTESEMIEKFNNGQLETYVLDNSKNIIEEIEFYISENVTWGDHLSVRTLIFLLDGEEIDFREWNSIFLEVNEDGIYNEILLEAFN